MSLPTEPFDFFTAGELPAPTLSPTEAAHVLAVLGVSGEVSELGSQQDQNFLIDGVGVLKLANPAFPGRDTLAQDAVAELVAEAFADLRVARVLRTGGAPVRAVVSTSAGELMARVLEFLPGGTFVDQPWLSPAVAARMGRIAAQVSLALADFDHPGLERRLQWDLRCSAEVVTLLAPAISDTAERGAVLAATEAAWAEVIAVADQLPVQAGHFDLTDDNLVRGGDGLPDGVIDFGDVSRSWRVAELAVTLTGLLHHTGPMVETVLAAVRAFHALRPLSEAEVAALWPLVVLRGAVLVASGRQQAALDASNDYAVNALDREWQIFAAATAVPLPVMTALLRDAVGMAPDESPLVESPASLVESPASLVESDTSLVEPPAPLVEPRRNHLSLCADTPALLDLSVTSEATNNGAWLDADLADRLAATAGFVAAPWGTPRLPHTRVLSPDVPATVPTALTLWSNTERSLIAPWPGTVTATTDGLTLTGGPLDLVLTLGHPGTVPGVPPTKVEPGAALLTFTGRLDVQLVRPGISVPLLVPSDLAPGWLAMTADPAPLFGLTPVTEAETDLLTRREAHVADVQEHYYADPPRIERGWRATLIDTGARAYLDMVNNVTSVGHAHPRITAAVAAQLARLNTNSRFHYGALPRFAEALAATLPDELDQVFLVNSGSEATDLAIRLAMAATGRRDIVALAEAYHGWTYASDAVSTSVADNPNALTTRPDWVHTVEAPNPYRGRLRDADASGYGPKAAADIRALAASGRPVAGFIAESLQGNAGGIALPDGYLAEVYAAVREVGGVAIADEVQVGYGRLGEWFWGFQQQGVTPDIVAVAKSMGNGHPLGAVITTRAIAEAYRTGGYFFSSTGGSPVSATVGVTVLDIIRTEDLQENARVVGARLKAGLEALAERHACIGTVHGVGLYLGLELVADRDARTPDAALTRDLCERLRQLGVIMQPTGDHGNVLKIKPPLVVTADDVDFFVAMVDRALGELR
ncbi:MAG: 4-aminobutyrate aminotransferase [Actinobacteria bacterium HGW-Actinobacteria-2]|nr:MAG: 4-aminobutyrate aminotransferase [Actinobacteria bacterium HGW-Actinobacteria-2]